MSTGYLPRYVYSPKPSSEEKRSSSIISTRSMKNGLKTVAQKYKEHNRQTQQAWEAYYGVGQFAPSNTTTTRNNSSASESSVAKEPSAVQKAGKSLKQRWQEHHESVNAAYSTLYGSHQAQGQAMKQYSKAY